MKKLAALALALLMALSLTSAFAQTYTAINYYTIDYDENDLTLDDTSYTSENTADSQWLFMLSNDEYIIDASIDAVDGYEGFSLFSASQADRDSFVSDTLDSFSDENAALVKTVELSGGIPFYIFSMDNSDGPYYYAETIANGNSVNFCCYYVDASAALDDALLAHLVELLNTFKPVTTT